MTMDGPLVCWLQDCNKESVPLVGGKCASLGELINAGIRVPPGFAITTVGYRQFFDGADLGKTVADALVDVDQQDLDALEEVSARIRTWVEAASFSIELEDEIGEHYRRLSNHCRVPAVPVAIRSSATAEDLPGASFAGQQDTFLWIRGIDNVMSHTARCFSSLFTARAIAYRTRMGFDHESVSISVAVQKMANSAAAGVMFTINPTTGDPSSIVINSNFGFGESVVSGEVTPDEFLVSKITLEPLRRSIPIKGIYYAVDRESHTSRCMPLPLERQGVQSILDEDITELAKMGKTIEKHYGCAMDIEWAVDNDMPTGGNVFILQARPETVWSVRKAQPVTSGAKSPIDLILASMMAGTKTNAG